MGDRFWHDDIGILFRKDRLIEFFPTKDQTSTEKLNSIFRMAIYASIILYFMDQDIKYFLYAGIVGIATIIIYANRPAESLDNVDDVIQPKAEPEKNDCTKPTLENPFMNFTMQDFMNIKDGQTVDRAPACDPNDPEIKKEIDKFFDNNLYKDVNDVFGKMNSQRQFFTMPWTSVVPDPQGDFKNWLYKAPKTCKEDSDFCVRYEDLRQKTPVFVNPDVNPIKNS